MVPSCDMGQLNEPQPRNQNEHPHFHTWGDSCDSEASTGRGNVTTTVHSSRIEQHMSLLVDEAGGLLQALVASSADVLQPHTPTQAVVMKISIFKGSSLSDPKNDFCDK